MVQAKKSEAENAETINVGIVGHIAHGKTTLLQRLSGKWTDTHSEELKRGITIRLGYADVFIYEDHGKYNIEKKGRLVRHVSFVDSPGHEMLMATMLSGAAMIDAAILVVAANERIKPQTREHLMALQAKKVKTIIVAQNKIDLVDQKQAEKNYQEIKDLLKGKFDNVLVIPTSAQQGANIDVLLKAICDIPSPERKLDGDPIFVVARSFDINRPGKKAVDLNGAVLGGALKQGKLKVGDEIELRPGKVIKESNQIKYKTISTKVRKLFRGSGEVSEMTPGGSMSIETELDMALGRADSLAGNVVSLSGKLPETTEKMRVKFSLFKEVYGLGGHENVSQIKPGETLMLSINTSITGGSVKRVKGDEMEIDL